MPRKRRYPDPSKYADSGGKNQMDKYVRRKVEGPIERMTEAWLNRNFGSESKQSYSFQRRVKEEKTRDLLERVKMLHLRYKNMLLIILGIAAGVWIAYNPGVFSFLSDDPSLQYAGAFLMGLMYPVGITTPAAIVGFFQLAKVMNPLLLSAIGALGALATNFVVFYFIRHSMLDHLDKFTKKFNVRIHVVGHVVRKHPVLKHVIPIVAGIIIATPIPTEIAIGIFAAIKFEMKRFLVYAFVFSLVSILLVSQFGSAF